MVYQLLFKTVNKILIFKILLLEHIVKITTALKV